MPEMLLEECFIMLVSDSYQNMHFCHFCHDWCVHPIYLSPTCELNYDMSSLQRYLPCIFVINVVTSTSMQTRLRDIADFSLCSADILMPCKHDATERSMHILRYFSKGVLNMWFFFFFSCLLLQLWSSVACHLSALLLLQNVSWQIVYMLFNLAKLVIVDPCMLWTCSWLGLFHKHVFLMMLWLSCNAMTCGEWLKLVKYGTWCCCFARLNLLFRDAI